MDHQYCWIKVVKLGIAPLPSARTDVAVWAYENNNLEAFVTRPPLPVERVVTQRSALDRVQNAFDVGVIANCTPCPVGSNMTIAQRFVLRPPPSPADLRTSGGAAVTMGWQMECGSVAENVDERPEFYFAAFPMPAGTSREQALGWLETGPGKGWVEGAVTCTLVSHFQS